MSFLHMNSNITSLNIFVNVALRLKNTILNYFQKSVSLKSQNIFFEGFEKKVQIKISSEL